MPITTVLGNVEKCGAGCILPHEHLLIDLRKLVDRPADENGAHFFESLGMSNRWRVYNDPYALLDNAVIEEEDTALKELLLFKQAGGDTVADVTLDDIGRNPSALARLSRASGVNIVMGCGHYIAGAHPEKITSLSEKELAAEMIADLTEGVNGTGIKAGVIGEIGTSASISAEEYKVLKAAGIACLETGKSVHVHTSLYERNGLLVARTLLEMGVRSDRICIDHIDVQPNREYIVRLLDMGVYVEFDNFGKEFYVPRGNPGLLKDRFVYDLERAELIASLAEKGYLKQILISNDICLKSMLCEYGGNGYGHILRTVKSMLCDCGLSPLQYETIVKDNAAEFLCGE